MILQARIQELEGRLSALEARLAITSQTSNQPPSQDKPWLPKSERQKSSRSSGGQRGHAGKTLKMSEHPDEIRTLPITGHCGCGQPWASVAVSDLLARQVHDLPEVRLHVTEYQAEVKVCPQCHAREQAAFPAEVPGQVQYGPRSHGLTTYLNVVHAVPLERTAEVMDALCGARPSGGTIMLNLYLASSRLEGFEDQLKIALMEQNVLHTDETGSKVNGTLNWLHSVSNAQYTLYGQHASRGYAAIEEMGVLTRFEGVVAHDAWNTYFRLPGQHALCNAHLLRELRHLDEQLQQCWAGELRAALQGIYHQRKMGILTQTDKEAFYERFDALLLEGLNANPAAPPVPGRRGKPKQTPGRNLALRCQKHRDAVLLFLERDDVPFDNNQAERDIRMFCIKRKVSGGFRSLAGGAAFCRIRSYISTLRKQGINIWEGLVSVFRGDVQ
ncbi:IS66 family transposase, partial [Deinococcus saxicola]|uniref:IS66 family transposase n=2 Tax=Deinococcus saxicola TaxID=249406 RepID=UPI0039F02C54